MKKRVLIISDSFKGSLSSLKVGYALKKGLDKIRNIKNIKVMSVSDGGEGFLNSLNQNKDFHIHTLKNTLDLVLRKKETPYGILKDTVYLESAQTCGIELLEPRELDPTKTTSYGLGLIIKELVNQGYKNFVIGLGGTATQDGGAGLLAGLGYTFYNNQGEEFIPNGGNLLEIHRFTPSPLDLGQITCTLATDVTNTLLGESGATYTFAKQKGGIDLDFLETGMQHFASLFNNRHTSQDGSGAAGGIGFSLMNIITTNTKSGASILYDLLNLNSVFTEVDCIISGEGKIDTQTKKGKWVDFITQKCIEKQTDLHLFCGKSETKTYNGFPIYSIMESGINQKEAQRNAEELLENLAFKYFSKLE